MVFSEMAFLIFLDLTGVLVGEEMDITEKAEPGLSSITEPGLDMTRLASDMARGSSIWFCSTTCKQKESLCSLYIFREGIQIVFPYW